MATHTRVAATVGHPEAGSSTSLPLMSTRGTAGPAAPRSCSSASIGEVGTRGEM
jgi:hypothetical protein